MVSELFNARSLSICLSCVAGRGSRMEPWRAPIASLLARHNCTGVYLDFGTNIGVQIRKLFEPHKFEGAQVLPLFTEVFGAERCRTCAIGIEPNPRHTRRLDQLEARLGAVGAGVLVLRGAATTSEGSVHLALPALGTRMPHMARTPE